MRVSLFAGVVVALAASGCGGAADTGAPAKHVASLEGDAKLIAAAQTISDAIGGCTRTADGSAESKVVGLENGTIVMLACSVGPFSQTHRLFSINGKDPPKLLSLPDYDKTGWFGTDQASMAELDAGTGVLTTLRKSTKEGTCGSEGTYQWDGARFAAQEIHWQECGQPGAKGPPFQKIWPTQLGAEVDPNGATPEP